MRRSPSLFRPALLVLALALWLAGCSGNPGTAGGAIDVGQALERQQAGAVLLDVRTPGEYRQGHAVGAHLIPWMDERGRLNPDFFAQVAQLARPDQEVLVICQTGNRSAQAARALQQRGYGSAVNVFGGSIAWHNKGLPWEGTR
jgi:rhodanese-related sulfurtransferase